MTGRRSGAPRTGTHGDRATPRLVRALVAVLLTLAAGTTGAAVASADSPAPVTGISVTQDAGTAQPAIRITRLSPGGRQQAVLLLDGRHPERVRRMSVGVTSVTDLENGCVHPETASGDTSCGAEAGQGELSGFLDVALIAGRERPTGDKRACQPVGPAVATTLHALGRAPVLVGLPTDDGTLCVIATFAHRSEPGDNVTQTDAVRFDLRLRFDGLAVPAPTPTSSSPGTPLPSPSGSPPSTASPTSDGSIPGTDSSSGGDGDDGTQVEGVKHERPVVVDRVERGRADLGALPRTGASLLPQLVLGATALVVGAALLGVVRRRRCPR